MEIRYFFQMFRKDGLFKRIAQEYDLSCIIWKDGIFFPQKWYCFFKRRNTWKYDVFCTQAQAPQARDHAPLPKKNQRWSYPAKKHLKVIDILTDILERVPVILCTFMETLVGVFMYCFPARKKPGNLIYRIETWLLLQFFLLEIFYNEETSMPCTIQAPGAVSGGVLERRSRKLFVY